MVAIESGVFIALNAIAFGGWFMTAKWGWGVVLIVSFVIFGGLALYMFANTTVLQTKNVYDQNGVLTGSEKDVMIDSNQNTLGWIYFLLAGLSITWFTKIIVNMFRSRRVKASSYWTS